MSVGAVGCQYLVYIGKCYTLPSYSGHRPIPDVPLLSPHRHRMSHYITISADLCPIIFPNTLDMLANFKWPPDDLLFTCWPGAPVTCLFLPEASFGLRVLSSPASVCVSVCVNQLLVRPITWDPFKLGLPNLDQRCKSPWLRSLLFGGAIGLDFQGQI